MIFRNRWRPSTRASPSGTTCRGHPPSTADRGATSASAPSNCSSGEDPRPGRRRAAILTRFPAAWRNAASRASGKPRILLADEPTTARCDRRRKFRLAEVAERLAQHGGRHRPTIGAWSPIFAIAPWFYQAGRSKRHASSTSSPGRAIPRQPLLKANRTAPRRATALPTIEGAAAARRRLRERDGRCSRSAISTSLPARRGRSFRALKGDFLDVMPGRRLAS